MSRVSRVRSLLAAAALLAAFLGLAALVAGGHAAPGPDRWVADRLHGLSAGHDSVAGTARFVGRVSQPAVLRVAAAVGALALCRRRAWSAALWLALTMAAGGLLGIGAKLAYARPRPLWEAPIIQIGGYSYPSGHAVNAALFAGCALALLGASLPPAARVWLRVGAAGFVFLVGLDRMLLGVHYLSDVVGGWALGAAVVLAATAIHPPRL